MKAEDWKITTEEQPSVNTTKKDLFLVYIPTIYDKRYHYQIAKYRASKGFFVGIIGGVLKYVEKWQKIENETK